MHIFRKKTCFPAKAILNLLELFCGPLYAGSYRLNSLLTSYYLPLNLCCGIARLLLHKTNGMDLAYGAVNVFKFQLNYNCARISIRNSRKLLFVTRNFISVRTKALTLRFFRVIN